MQLETSTSSLDTQMAKRNAIEKVGANAKSALNQLGSWISANAAKATLFTALTFTAPEVFGQKVDVVKDNIKKEESYKQEKTDDAKNRVKIVDEQIKDSAEYKKEREELLKEWERVKKINDELTQRNELRKEQLEMLTGPLKFFNKVQEQGGVFTERDGKFARAGISIIDKTVRISEVQILVPKVRKLLVYISSQAPQQVITMN